MFFIRYLYFFRNKEIILAGTSHVVNKRRIVFWEKINETDCQICSVTERNFHENKVRIRLLKYVQLESNRVTKRTNLSNNSSLSSFIALLTLG
jgi:hypothetical protein